MGAFFLHHKSSSLSSRQLDEIYEKKGFIHPAIFTLGDYHLRLYPKQLIGIPNFYSDGTKSVYACGSLFYKGLGYVNSLKTLLKDHFADNIDPMELYGNYVLLFYDEIRRKINFFIDPACIKNVYYSETDKVISSDFLAILHSTDRKFSLNNMAIIENITTGHLIPPDTCVYEILKLDKVGLNSLNKHFDGISFGTAQPPEHDAPGSRDSAIDDANHKLTTYFKSVAELSDEFGAHIGLTGGFDSRLLLMHARKHLKNLMTNSFWRTASNEYNNAKELARVSGLDFFSFEYKPFIKPSFEVMMNNAFYFFDGQVRSQNRWDEEFNQPDYAAEISQGKYVGFHGSGGEQYRNADRFYGKISLKQYILYHWMFRQCNDSFLDKDIKQEVYENIKVKIFRITGIQEDKIDLDALKRIQNEVWNVANRTTRVNVLNQQQFYFAPFTEVQLSYPAYHYVPFLGKSLSFQIDMMKCMDQELSALITNYGFNLIEGEKRTDQILPFIVQLLPAKLFNAIYHQIKHTQKAELKTKFEIRYQSEYFKSCRSRLDLHKLNTNVNLAPVAFAMNHFLKIAENQINP
jgi:hypothetical protein